MTLSLLFEMTTHNREILQSMLNSLAKTDKAWTTSSTAGTSHIQNVCNALLTFADYALLPPESAPAGEQLYSLHESATESLLWLQKTLVRLTAALSGARQTEETFLAAAMDETSITSDLNEWSPRIPMTKWTDLVKKVNDGFQNDLQVKKGVMDLLQKSIMQGCPNREELEVGMGTWLVESGRTPGIADLIATAFQAEQLALADWMATSDIASPKIQKPIVARKAEKSESPTIAMLRQTGKSKKR